MFTDSLSSGLKSYYYCVVHASIKSYLVQDIVVHMYSMTGMDSRVQIWQLSSCLLSGLYAGSNYCQSHVLVDTWMLTVKLVYKLSNCT